MQFWIVWLLALLMGLGPGCDGKTVAVQAQEKKVPPAPLPQKAAHETYIVGQKQLVADSTAALRVTVKGAVSLTESVPVPDAHVLVTFNDNTELKILYDGKTGADGNADVQFIVPDVAEGKYQLRIATASRYGTEKIEETIQIERKEKILLVTDKPMYQPSQTMHIRALALRPMNLRPLAQKELLLEVEDSKSNKVFKERLQTDDYGIAYSTFTLAEEVNTGSYRITATMGENKAEKTVTVEKYVLPKFKVALSAEKEYFLPGDKVKGKIQGDYFFGKPVAGGTVKISAATFDVEFKEFAKLEGTTEASGNYAFEFKLPDYLIGQPLEQGDGLLKITAELTDKAMHTEKKTATFPVAKQPIRLAVVPESGKLVPEVVNQVYVIASYPDGKPAAAKVSLQVTTNGQVGTTAEGKTDLTGIATLILLPKREEFRASENHLPPDNPRHWKNRWPRRPPLPVPVKNGPPATPTQIMPVLVKAQDSQGNQAEIQVELSALATRDSLLVRPNQAIYRGGETMAIDLLSTFTSGTVYLDILKEGQQLLTKTVELKEGRGKLELPASSDLFGSLVVYAYKLLDDGTWIRASRRIYVQPPTQIQIAIQPDKEVYRPGENALLRLLTTDAKGKPQPAALGLTIVDEAVYALQEMQPGLEKVYFTLEKEVTEPKYQIKYGPSDSLPFLIRDDSIPAVKQKAATILMAQSEEPAAFNWDRNPQMARRTQFASQLSNVFYGLFNHIHIGNVISQKGPDGKWGYQPNLLQDVVHQQNLQADVLQDPLGHGILAIEDLAKLDILFTYDKIARLATAVKIGKLHQAFYLLSQERKDHRAMTLADLVKRGKAKPEDLIDCWGQEFRYTLDSNNAYYYVWELREITIVSAGPDGKFDNEDDIRTLNVYQEIQFFRTLSDLGKQISRMGLLRGSLGMFDEEGGAFAKRPMMEDRMVEAAREDHRPMPVMAMKADPGKGKEEPALPADTTTGNTETTSASTVAPPRVREYFPETLLFEPRLITDKKGQGTLRLEMADSITTWRVTASANTKNGLLGGTTSALRVFQDFFVDIDFPVALTQSDEVSVPVAIFNYLPIAQKVRLVVEKADWFELLDDAEKSVTMPSKEVGVVYFRLKAQKIGYQRLTIMAYGTKMSDAVRRQVEIVPDGKKVEEAINGQLSQTVEHTLHIPDNSIVGASKILVKCYPGVGAVLVEGLDGMLRMPGG